LFAAPTHAHPNRPLTARDFSTLELGRSGGSGNGGFRYNVIIIM
jgi:hypothetical protein